MTRDIVKWWYWDFCRNYDFGWDPGKSMGSLKKNKSFLKKKCWFPLGSQQSSLPQWFAVQPAGGKWGVCQHCKMAAAPIPCHWLAERAILGGTRQGLTLCGVLQGQPWTTVPRWALLHAAPAPCSLPLPLDGSQEPSIQATPPPHTHMHVHAPSHTHSPHTPSSQGMGMQGADHGLAWAPALSCHHPTTTSCYPGFAYPTLPAAP